MRHKLHAACLSRNAPGRARRAQSQQRATFVSQRASMTHEALQLLEGHVRNPREARALVALDVSAVRQSAILDHLLACCAHERELARLLDELAHRRHAVNAGDGVEDPKLNAAVALVTVGLDAVRADLNALLPLASAELDAIVKLRGELDWFRSCNQSLVEELQREGVALAASKERLWLVEESLLLRLDGTIRSLASAVTAREPCARSAIRCVVGE